VQGFGANCSPTLLGSLLQLTVPCGALFVPVAVSLTFAVQVVDSPAANELGVQLTDVLVERLVTVTVVLSLLTWCFPSPLYVPLIVCVSGEVAIAVGV
jgi:hypothetical protein